MEVRVQAARSIWYRCHRQSFSGSLTKPTMRERKGCSVRNRRTVERKARVTGRRAAYRGLDQAALQPRAYSRTASSAIMR